MATISPYLRDTAFRTNQLVRGHLSNSKKKQLGRCVTCRQRLSTLVFVMQHSVHGGVSGRQPTRTQWEVGGEKKKLKVDGNAKMQNLVQRLSSHGLDGKNFRETHFSIVCIIFNMKRNLAYEPFFFYINMKYGTLYSRFYGFFALTGSCQEKSFYSLKGPGTAGAPTRSQEVLLGIL